jgi:hypothetical protein
MTYQTHDALMLQLTSTHENLSVTDVLKDVSRVLTASSTCLLLFFVFYFNKSGLITGENYYSIIDNDM